MRTKAVAMMAVLVVALALTTGPMSYAGAQASTAGEVTTQVTTEWSTPACVYLYMCVQARVECVQIGYDVVCSAYSRSFFAPASWSISVNAKLFLGGFTPLELASHTTDCGYYRDGPAFGSCATAAHALVPTNGVYVARAVAWRNGDKNPRPVAYAKLAI